MTEPVTPPNVEELPPAPERGNRSTFRTLAEAFISALSVFRTQLVTLATNCYNNALIAYNSAISALGYKTDAESARDAAVAMGNYVGEWSSLTGSISQGESVSHNDELWMAISAIADITTSEPSRINSDWFPLSDVHGGKQTIFIPAGAMTPRETNGAESGSVETATNKIMMESIDFDAASVEYAQFTVRMPKSWDAGTVTAQFIWSHNTTTTNFGVRFFIQGLALSNDNAIDTAFGTAVGHTADTGGTTNDIYITDMTADIILSNTPVKSDFAVFQVYRDVSDAGDTLAVDARLHGVVLIYNTDANTDD